MLVKLKRLVRDKDFERVFRLGRAHYTKLFGAKILANQKDNNCFGIIISSKVSKKSTERNKLKRQIRQIVKELDRNMISGFDLAIIALPDSLNCDYQAIRRELEKIFHKLGLFK